MQLLAGAGRSCGPVDSIRQSLSITFCYSSRPTKCCNFFGIVSFFVWCELPIEGNLSERLCSVGLKSQSGPCKCKKTRQICCNIDPIKSITRNFISWSLTASTIPREIYALTFVVKVFLFWAFTWAILSCCSFIANFCSVVFLKLASSGQKELRC